MFDYINESRLLPIIDKNLVKQRGQDEVTDYLIRLVRVLSEDLLGVYTQTLNNILHITNVGYYYFASPNINGIYSDGTWRFALVSSGIELQKKISGSWVKQARWEE